LPPIKGLFLASYVAEEGLWGTALQAAKSSFILAVFCGMAKMRDLGPAACKDLIEPSRPVRDKKDIKEGKFHCEFLTELL